MEEKIFVIPYYLKSLCESEATFERGRDYYLDLTDRVKNFSLVGDTVYTEVIGRRTYNVSISFRYGRIFEHTCNCEAHQHYKGPCKHVIATILDLNARSHNFYCGGPEPKDITFIRGDYLYPKKDLDKISEVCFEAIKECCEEGSIDAAEFHNIVKYNAYDETSDPYFFEGERANYVLTVCYDLASKNGIKIDGIEECEQPDDFIEDDVYEDCYEPEEDRAVDSGYRDDYDYNED